MVASECIEILDGYGAFNQKVKELKVFFELNSNIRIFYTDPSILCVNWKCFLGSNIKLDRLDIDVDFGYNNLYNLPGLLNELFDQGFYKRLHMICTSLKNQRDLDYITSVRGIEKVDFINNEAGVTISSMPDLKELVLYSDEIFGNWETMAKNMVNLECLCIRWVKQPNTMLPFLRYFPRLREIKMSDNFGTHSSFENDIVDLVTYNKERSKLAGARKVTIYVREALFLATKFSKVDTEFGLVKLKRLNLVEWDDL